MEGRLVWLKHPSSARGIQQRGFKLDLQEVLIGVFFILNKNREHPVVKPYQHLTEGNRKIIAHELGKNSTYTTIAKMLAVRRTTVSREVRRNVDDNGPYDAQMPIDEPGNGVLKPIRDHDRKPHNSGKNLPKRSDSVPRNRLPPPSFIMGARPKLTDEAA